MCKDRPAERRTLRLAGLTERAGASGGGRSVGNASPWQKPDGRVASGAEPKVRLHAGEDVDYPNRVATKLLAPRRKLATMGCQARRGPSARAVKTHTTGVKNQIAAPPIKTQAARAASDSRTRVLVSAGVLLCSNCSNMASSRRNPRPVCPPLRAGVRIWPRRGQCVSRPSWHYACCRAKSRFIFRLVPCVPRSKVRTKGPSQWRLSGKICAARDRGRFLAARGAGAGSNFRAAPARIPPAFLAT